MGNKELEIIDLAISYVKAIKITQSRVHSEEFWASAGEDDLDDIDLEESLAQIRLVSAVDKYLEG